MSKNDNRYAWLDTRIEDHYRFIEAYKKDSEQNQKILQKIKAKSRKEKKDVTENS